MPIETVNSLFSAEFVCVWILKIKTGKPEFRQPLNVLKVTALLCHNT